MNRKDCVLKCQTENQADRHPVRQALAELVFTLHWCNCTSFSSGIKDFFTLFMKVTADDYMSVGIRNGACRWIKMETWNEKYGKSIMPNKIAAGKETDRWNKNLIQREVDGRIGTYLWHEEKNSNRTNCSCSMFVSSKQCFRISFSGLPCTTTVEWYSFWSTM